MFPSLTRFPGDLFAEMEGLQRQVEQLLGVRNAPSSIRAAQRGAFPAINMGVTEDAIEVYAFAPGVDPASIDVSVDNGVLTVAGERRTRLPAQDEKVSIYAEERFDGAFRRAIALPEDADTARIEAAYRNGVLKIAIPKREASKPRRIEVKA